MNVNAASSNKRPDHTGIDRFGYLAMALLLGIMTLLFTSCTGSEPRATDPNLQLAAGRVDRYKSFPSSYVARRNIDVWLPEGYSEAKPLPVLYMHDGQMLFDSTTTWNKQEWGVDEELGSLIRREDVRRVIVVGIWNIPERRHSEYFPEKPFNALPEPFRDSLLTETERPDNIPLFDGEIRSNEYLKFIVDELKPFIDRTYATLPGVENTFVMGSSMGGLVSMYAACEYPDVFGGAACLSTHWPGIFTVEDNPIPGSFAEYMRSNLPEPGSHKFYFDLGTATLDSLYRPLQARIDSVMIAAGYDRQNWTTKTFTGHDHSERSWSSRLDYPLKFLLATPD